MNRKLRFVQITYCGLLGCGLMMASGAIGSDQPQGEAPPVQPPASETTVDDEAYAAEVRNLLEKGFQPQKYPLQDTVAHFKTASELSKSDPRLYYASGLVCLKHDRAKEALPSLKRSVEQDGDYGPAWQTLVRTEVAQQQYDQAFEHLVAFAKRLANIDDEIQRHQDAGWLGQVLVHLQSSDEHPDNVRKAAGRRHVEVSGMLQGELLANYEKGRQEMTILLDKIANSAGQPIIEPARNQAARPRPGSLTFTPGEVVEEKLRLAETSQQIKERNELARDRTEKELADLNQRYEVLMNECRMILLAINSLEVQKKRLELLGVKDPAIFIAIRWEVIVFCANYKVNQERLARVAQQAESLRVSYNRSLVAPRGDQAAIIARNDLLDKWQQKLANKPDLSRDAVPPPASRQEPDDAAQTMDSEPPTGATPATEFTPKNSRRQRQSEKLNQKKNSWQDEQEAVRLSATAAADQALEANNRAWESLLYKSSKREECMAAARVDEAAIDHLQLERGRVIDGAKSTSYWAQAEIFKSLELAEDLRRRIQVLSAQKAARLAEAAQFQQQVASDIQAYHQGVARYLTTLNAMKERHEKLGEGIKHLDRSLAKMAPPVTSRPVPSGKFADCFPLNLDGEKERLIASLNKRSRS